MRSRWILSAVMIAVAAMLAASSGGPAQAATASSGNLRLLYFSGDAIRNYDFLNQTVAANNVDWAVDLLFYNNANINKIKSALNGQYGDSGSGMWGRMSDDGGATYTWDSDGGKKKGDCVTVYTHYRIYAPSSTDYMYNPSMGYYLFGTTHHDYQECYPPATYGYSEGAEQEVNSYADSVFGTANRYDWANFYNYESFRVEGDHTWDQDGFASYVIVP